MINLKKEIDVSKINKLLSKIVLGIATVDSENPIWHRLDISKVKFKKESRSLYLDFFCIYGFVKITFVLDEFTIEINRSINKKEYTSDFNLVNCSMTGDSEVDKVLLTELLELVGEQPPIGHNLFFTLDDCYTSILSSASGNVFCRDSTFAYTFIKQIGKDLGFISEDEYVFLMNSFSLGKDPLRFNEIELYIDVKFRQAFDCLKQFHYDVNNEFFYNCGDNYCYYLENNNIQGIVFKSQSHLFLIARDDQSSVLKIWKTISIDTDWFDSIDNQKDSIFDIEDYLKSCSWDLVFPFEMKHVGYSRSVSTLMNHFHTIKSGLIYDSNQGFFQNQSDQFEPLINAFDYGCEILFDSYSVEEIKTIQNNINYKTPDYYIRRSLHHHMGVDRATALYKLFSSIDSKCFWDGEGFVIGNNYVVDYPQHPNEKVAGIIVDNPFKYLNFSPMFSLPETLTHEWVLVFKEYMSYIQLWLNNHQDKTSDEYETALIYFAKLKSTTDYLTT